MFTFNFSLVNVNLLDKAIDSEHRYLSFSHLTENSQSDLISNVKVDLLVNIKAYITGERDKESCREFMAMNIRKLRNLGAMGLIENLYSFDGDFARIRKSH